MVEHPHAVGGGLFLRHLQFLPGALGHLGSPQQGESAVQNAHGAAALDLAAAVFCGQTVPFLVQGRIHRQADLGLGGVGIGQGGAVQPRQAPLQLRTGGSNRGLGGVGADGQGVAGCTGNGRISEPAFCVSHDRFLRLCFYICKGTLKR